MRRCFKSPLSSSTTEAWTGILQFELFGYVQSLHLFMHFPKHTNTMKRFDAPESSSSSSSSPRPAAKRQRCPAESSASEDQCVKGRSELLLTQLAMYPGEEMDDSVHSSNGKSKERIKGVLNGSLCKCKRQCYKVVNFAMVYKVCLAFWSLSKAAQDTCLWGIQHMASDYATDLESDSTSSSSSSGSESGSGCPTSKHLNCWFIQGWNWVFSHFLMCICYC